MSEPFAVALKNAGVIVGDVVEIIHKSDSIDVALANALDETQVATYGWLVEITAIGENVILGFSLEGRPLESSSDSYSGLRWWRDDGLGERLFRQPFKFLKVGNRAPDGYSWEFPERVNVYTRCQESK